MGAACPVPRSSEQVVRVGRIGHQIHESHDFSLLGARHRQHGFPISPAVFRAVHGPSAVGGIQFPQGRHPHAVRVDCVNDDPSDVVASFQTPPAPRLPVVVAHVHAVAGIGTPRGIHLARPHNNPSGRVRSHRSEHAGLVQQRFKRSAVVDAFPKPTCRVRHVHGVRHNGKVHHPASHHGRTDVPEFQSTCPRCCGHVGTFFGHSRTRGDRTCSPCLGMHHCRASSQSEDACEGSEKGVGGHVNLGLLR